MIVGTSMGALIGAAYLQRENIEVVEQLAKDIISTQFARTVGFEKKKGNKKRLKKRPGGNEPHLITIFRIGFIPPWFNITVDYYF